MSVFNATRIIGKTVLVTGASSGIGAVSRWSYERDGFLTAGIVKATAILFAKVCISDCSRPPTRLT